jgi:hypothetical protein
MNIQEKYKNLRPLIKDGDIILFHGKSLISRIIRFCDKATYNHVGVVVEKLGSLYIVDSNESGVQADRLSWRIRKYKGGDFIIIQSTLPAYQVQDELNSLLQKADQKWIKYDYLNGVKELLNRGFGFKFRITKRDEHDICSDYVSDYAVNLSMVKRGFLEQKIQFPQDYIRYRNLDNTRILN